MVQYSKTFMALAFASVFVLAGCQKDNSDKFCWSCTQTKLWEPDKNGLQTKVVFDYNVCNKSEKGIQQLIKDHTYSAYEGGGSMNSTMTCNKNL